MDQTVIDYSLPLEGLVKIVISVPQAVIDDVEHKTNLPDSRKGDLLSSALAWAWLQDRFWQEYITFAVLSQRR